MSHYIGTICAWHVRYVLTRTQDVANIRAMTGLELKLQRTARRVRTTDLARVMGVNHSRISQIESLSVVTQRSAARYLAALATFPDVVNNGTQEAA